MRPVMTRTPSTSKSRSRTAAAVFAVLALFVPVVLASCASVGSKDRSTGELIDDAAIVTKVKAKLAGDSEVSAFKIDVDSNRGVVTLTGSVSSETARRRAIEDARSVDNVVSVIDRLRIER